MGWLWSTRRKAAADRLEALILEAALTAHREGNDDLALALYDASRIMRSAIGRRTWRSLATRDDAGLQEIVDRMVSGQRGR
jgi:hypothetical protein